MIAGFAGMLARFATLGDKLPPLFIWLAALVVGSYCGVAGLYIHAALNTIVGRLLGGRGSAAELRAALAWAAAPAVLGFALWLVLLFLLGSNPHGVEPVVELSKRGSSILAAAEMVVGAGAVLWQIVLTVLFVAQAHRFKVGRALLSCVLTIAVILAAVLGILIVAPRLVTRFA